MTILTSSAQVVSAAGLTRTSTGEEVQFWFLAIIAVLGALGMVFARKAVHSALSLAATMICLAICYLAQGAYFLGVVQVAVYTGAIMMLFLFVLMLVGVDSSDSLVETIRGQRWWAVVAALAFGIMLVAGIGNVRFGRFAGTSGLNAGGNVNNLALTIFHDYYWAFELTSALLITAALGAMVLAHRERSGDKPTQRELAEQRFKRGGLVTPLPSPGVYARHNAVDVPALLPDGSVAELSLNRTISGAREQVNEPEPGPADEIQQQEVEQQEIEGADR
jgi:NADH-quinone oxidoreductase subunit J